MLIIMNPCTHPKKHSPRQLIQRANERTNPSDDFFFLGKTNDARVACDDWIDWRKWMNLERALKWTITKKDIFNRQANAALSSLFCSFLLLYKHYEAELLLHVKAASLRHHLTIFCLFLEKMYVGYSNSIVLVFFLLYLCRKCNRLSHFQMGYFLSVCSLRKKRKKFEI